MAIDLEDDILQDFLVEAGEILESLNEQLVELEQSPEDSNLLNSIFRGFHTIKGGGSFLSLTNLVEVCHKSEDVFNLLRNHEISLTANMMDTFLRVLDEVNSMFDQIKSGEDPSAADPALINELINMQDPAAVAKTDHTRQGENGDQGHTVDDQPDETPEESSHQHADTAAQGFVSGKDEITDDEFESLLDVLQDVSADQKAEASAESTQKLNDSDEITDDEFEALLDELHGKGGAPKSIQEDKSSKSVNKEEKARASTETDDDNITDEEFESLLDDMHGKGKGPTSNPVKGAEKVRDTGKSKNSADNTTGKEESKKTVAAAKPAATPARKENVVARGETTVRVDTSRLDDIMNLVGELVLTRNRLNTLRLTLEDERVHKAISSLDVVTADLQTAVMKTRMQPVKKVFGRFPRVVRDLARSLNKEISLELEGEETDLDKNLVEALADPLVHLVRNSVDHGVEMPEVREKAGKPRQGKVILSAQQEGDHILLSICDDGAGMDPDIVRNNAINKGLIDAETASRLDDKGCFDLIFLPGLSTKEQISDVSGRGVGMDVVKTKIAQLNGTIDIQSELGKGTQLRIKVPLTLAILPTLMVQLGDRKFALPLSIVNEIFEFSSKKFSVVDGREVVLNRGKAPPVFNLRKWLLNGSDTGSQYEGDPHVIMVQVGNTSAGFIVDQVIGQEEVVIKPLDRMLQGLPGMAGSTITGDGNIAIILDVPGLLKNYA